MQRREWHRTALISAMTLVGCFLVGTAFGAYLGSGKWPSSSLRRCHLGSYATACSNAAAVWNNNTQLTLGYNCGSLNFQTLGGNYGNNGFFGYAYICAGPRESDCNDQQAWNGTYTYAEARNNVYYLDSWNPTQRQFNCTHELGHCWSLGHDSRASSVMNTGRRSTIALDETNRANVNSKY